MSGRRVCTADDFYSLVGLTDPQISPDGKLAAVVETRSHTETDSYRYALRIFDLKTQRDVVLDVAEGTIHSPLFSPDGEFISAIRLDGESARVDRVSTRGALADALSAHWETLFEAEGLSPVLHQDLDGALYVSVRHRAKQSGLRVIRNPHYKQDGGGFMNPVAGTTEFYRIRLSSGTTSGAASPGAEKIHEVGGSVVEFAVAADGTRLAYTLQPSSGDRYHVSDLWTVDLSSGSERRVLASTGSVSTLTFLPDNQSVAWIGNQSTDTWGDGSKLYATNVISEETKQLLPDFDRPLAPYAFGDICPDLPGSAMVAKPDGTGLWFLASDHGVSSLYASSLDARQPERLPVTELRTISRFAVSADGEAFVFVATDVSQPDKLLLWVNGEPSVLHDVNAEEVADVEWAGEMHLKFTGAAEWPMEGWLLLPPASGGYDAPYPLVMVIHGGPHNAYGYGFEFEFQHLAARGYAVLWMNPRGSQTYGEKFAHAVNGDWGGADFEDLMRGVDAAIKTGLVDPDRMGVTGYSYGGYMTNWIVTHTNRFRAAATGGCVSNLVSISGTSDVGRELGAHEVGALVAHNHALMWERSPLAHIANVETPCLIYHGDADIRCPLGQAEEFFSALLTLGKETEMVLFPGMSHLFILNGPPTLKVERYRLLADWFGGKLS